MNKSFLTGRLTRDIELKYTTTQTALVRFTVAVDRMKEGVDFIDCVAFGKTAENMERFLHKGSMVGVFGRIQTGSYDKDGTKVKTFDIIAENVEFLGGKEEKKEEFEPHFEAVDEDMPF